MMANYVRSAEIVGGSLMAVMLAILMDVRLGKMHKQAYTPSSSV